MLLCVPIQILYNCSDRAAETIPHNRTSSSGEHVDIMLRYFLDHIQLHLVTA